MASGMLGPGSHSFAEDEVASIRLSLLQWYGRCKRDLPWRTLASSTEDPNVRAYAVWVSEVMLQQTQVATVISYYNRWMEKWPTVSDLSRATLEEVKEVWSGLGYYRRATRLWEGACKVVKELNGEIPQTAQELMTQLPGVGRYTAGAIASIAFSEVTGVLDGNVTRVMCRLRGIGGNPSKAPVEAHLWSLAQATVDPTHPGDFNQALMELGARVCTPKGPDCRACPLREHCLAYKRVATGGLGSHATEGKEVGSTQWTCIEDCQLCLPSDQHWDPSLGVMNFPRKVGKKKPKEEKFVVAVVCSSCDVQKARLLLVQRPEKGLLAGMWEFPSFQVESDVDTTGEEVLREQLLACGVSPEWWSHPERVGEVFHVFSHLTHCYTVFKVVAERHWLEEEVVLSAQPHRWVDGEDINNCALSTAMKKVFRLASQAGSGAKRRAHDSTKETAKPMKMRKLEAMWKQPA